MSTLATPAAEVFAVPLDPREARLTIEEFNLRYGEVLDRGPLGDWPDLFTQDGRYRLTARENAEAGLPIGLIYCDGRGMLRDRVAAIEKTATYAPRHLTHLFSHTLVRGVDAAGEISATTNFVVFQTLMDEPTKVFLAGQYVDRLVFDGGGIKLRERLCVYDSQSLPNSLIFPV